MADEEWRDWRLVWYDGDLLRRKPGEKPPKNAELSADGAWASAYVEHDGRTIVAAMWMRYRMQTKTELARLSKARRAAKR